ncbi:MAG: 1-acyl-sn-glycerol-3-phosphate acyltransferase [Firmicutes bacterium]|nr:1-acyl-sn-glycerol-3-phosphate acyltransferase [Bacillota bacterium]
MIYQIFKFLFSLFLKITCRYQVIGIHNFPSSGPALVVSNHISNWDPLIVGSAMPRQINFIAKSELARIPLVGYLFKAWGVVPIKIGHSDREALSKSLTLLKNGKVMGIFIEGKRNLGNPEIMIKPQPGAAMLALKGAVPVVPVAVINTNRILRSLKRVKVIIGKPIDFSTKLDLKNLDRKEQYSQVSMELITTIQELVKKGL